MNSNPRAETIQILTHLLAIHPTMRFGQLVSNLAAFADSPAFMTARATWVVEDAALLARLEDHYQQQIRRLDLTEPPPLDDPLRSALIAEFSEYADRNPGVPLGRLLATVVGSVKRPSSECSLGESIYDIEDDVFLAGLRRHVAAGPGSVFDFESLAPLPEPSAAHSQ